MVLSINICIFRSERQHYDLFPDFTPSSDATVLELSLLSLGNSSLDLDFYLERAGKFEFEIQLVFKFGLN